MNPPSPGAVLRCELCGTLFPVGPHRAIVAAADHLIDEHRMHWAADPDQALSKVTVAAH